MPTDHCPVCNKPLSTHPDGLACCPCGSRAVRWEPKPEQSGGRWFSFGCSVCPIHVAGQKDPSAWNRRAPHAETLALRAENERLRGQRDNAVQELSSWLEWARAHGHLAHAQGIATRTKTILAEIATEEPAHD